MPRSRSRCSTVDSNASIVRGSSPRAQPASSSSASIERGDVPPEPGEVGRVLDLEHDADLAALLERRRRAPGRARRAAAAPAARRRTTRCVGRSFGSRSRQRSVESSSHVKSSVNQPVSSAPSIVFVVRRSANSGRSATSVVPEISFSCRTTSTPSLRDDDVGLDRVDAHREREVVRRARVLRPVAGRAAVSDDERAGPGHRFRLPAGAARRRRHPDRSRSKPSHSADPRGMRRVGYR